jgi:hypothetical protein
MTLNDVRIIELPKIEDTRGNLSIIEELNQIPFKIKRVYWIYDVPGGETRGGHAYKSHHEFIVALSGSFDVILDDGHRQKIYSLNRSYYGIYLPNKIWRKLENFSTNSFCLILASDYYNISDYIYDYSEFLGSKNG